jgi:hypothetical protein
MKPQPLFVAPDANWTGVQTIQAFAEQEGRELAPRDERGLYQFVDGTRQYRTTIVQSGRGWVYAVYLDDEKV